MRVALLILIALAIGLGIYYVMFSKQGGMQTQINNSQNQAMQAADEYRKNQADMMKQLGQ